MICCGLPERNPHPHFRPPSARATLPGLAAQGEDGTVRIEMAPLSAMPYSVLTFLDMVTEEWQGGAFHRNAGHVKQARRKEKG